MPCCPAAVRSRAYDTQEYQGSGLQPGDSVRLAGVPGLLAAGEYALLPARYALLPGAVLVEVVPGVQDLGPNQVAGLPDGTPVVAGVRTIAGTGIADSRTTGFAIRPGSYARQLAEYRDSYGNTFFSAQGGRARPAGAAGGARCRRPAAAGRRHARPGRHAAARCRPGRPGEAGG